MISGRVEISNLRVQKNIFGDFLLKNQSFVLILGLRAKILQNFPEMLSAIFAELTSLCPEEQIEKTSVLWKIQTFLSNPYIEQYPNITFGKRGFGKPLKKDFYSSREAFWRKQFFENFYKSDLFLNLGRKRLAGWSNHLHVYSGTVLKSWTSWAKSKFFCRSHTLCETLSQLQTKMQCCQFSIQHLQWNISRKK